jgi:uncharacterized protein YifE (UPF0438 family)
MIKEFNAIESGMHPPRSTKQDHLRFIKENCHFPLDCKSVSFSNEEIEILEKYIPWFNALISGELEPITDKQKRFILVSLGKEDPFSLEEVAWWKYLDQKDYEARRNSGAIMNYLPQQDTFYNRDMAKKMKSTMFKIMKDNHKNG